MLVPSGRLRWESLCIVRFGRGFAFVLRGGQRRKPIYPHEACPLLFFPLPAARGERGLYLVVVLILLGAPECELLPSFASCSTGQPEPRPWLLLSEGQAPSSYLMFLVLPLPFPLWLL